MRKVKFSKKMRIGTKYKERPFAFLTTDGFRIEVYAIHPIQAYYRARKQAVKHRKTMTSTYTTYGRRGIDTGWKHLSGVRNRSHAYRAERNLLNSGEEMEEDEEE
jgi:hypothetical protein